MITAERQFEIACDLARSNEAHKVCFVCTRKKFRDLQLTVADCSISLQTRRITFPNGASLFFVDPDHVAERPQDYGGYQMTPLFYTEESKLAGVAIRMLESKLRSTVIKELKTYHPYGYTSLMNWELYK